MANRCLTIVAASALALSAPLQASEQNHAGRKSATLARDVNGFELGMSLAEAKANGPLRYIGGDQFEATKAGFTYNFGVSPAGRIYRISSKQQFRRFAVDHSFLSTLEHRLSEKYGPPHEKIGDDHFSWELIETMHDRSGEAQPMKTMWMTARMSGSGSEHELLITIVDFRILWQDQARANAQPRQSAMEQIQF